MAEGVTAAAAAAAAARVCLSRDSNWERCSKNMLRIVYGRT